MPRTVFWGTPQAAVPFLEYLAPRVQLVGAVTRTDKPAERGRKVRPSPVKAFAESKGILVLQPSDLRDPDFLGALARLEPEVGIVVAYGRLLPKEAFGLFPSGCYNIHFSLLPRLRGAAPIQWAIARGEARTGVTSFRLSETLDTGPIVARMEIGIRETDDAVSLEEKLIPVGIQVLEETLARVGRNEAAGEPQSGEATSAPLVKKSDLRVDWKSPADEIARRVRAFVRSGCHAFMPDGRLLKILRAERGDDAPEPAAAVPGTVMEIKKNLGFSVQCRPGRLWVLRVQPEGRKEIDAWSFLQGYRLRPGEILA